MCSISRQALHTGVKIFMKPSLIKKIVALYFFQVVFENPNQFLVGSLGNFMKFRVSKFV